MARPRHGGRHSEASASGIGRPAAQPTQNLEPLRHETAATVAILLACGSALAATACWMLLLLPAGNVRFNPLFWLLALPFGVWFWPLSRYRPGALRHLRLALVAWPLVGFAVPLLAEFAPGVAVAQALAKDAPLAPLIAAILSALAAACSFLVLRRSSLPGGVRRPRQIATGVAATDPPTMRGLPFGSLGIGGPLVVFLLFVLADQSAPVRLLSPILTGLGVVVLVGHFALLTTAMRRGARAPDGAPYLLMPALLLGPAICLVLTGANAMALRLAPDPARDVFGWMMLGITLLTAALAWLGFRRWRALLRR